MRITDDLKKEIHEQLTSAYPEFHDLRLGPFSEITGGVETTIFAFDLVPKTDRIPLIFRAHRARFTEAARKESRTMQALYPAGVSVPRPYLLVDDSSVLDRAYLVIERIEGQLLSEAILAAGTGPRFDRLIREYMKRMASLHAMDWRRDLSYLDTLDVGADPNRYVERALLSPRTRIKEHSIDELAAVIKWMEENCVETKEVCLLHGDYHAMNVMVRGDSGLVTIDWTDAVVGDFRTDLGYALAALTSTGLDIREQVIAEYEAASGRVVEDLEYFEVLSILWNLIRIYSALFDHRITGESENTAALLTDAYQEYSRHLVKVTQRATGASLKKMLDALR